ncbi:MAG: helix-turn-helix transcriptional regulator [Colwellia sp.]
MDEYVEGFSERVRLIRKKADLSRAKFAQKIGVPAATMDGVESKGRTPRGDFLEKIARVFPSYIMFLLMGESDYSIAQTSPPRDKDSEFYEPRTFNIVDIVDARFMAKSIIKPSSLKKMYLIQSKKNENDLGAIITIDDEVGLETRAIWVGQGNINFASRHGGKLALKVFRQWLTDNAPQVLEDAELKSGFSGMMDFAEKNHKFFDFGMVDIDPNDGLNELLQASFEDWASGKEDW